MKLKLANRKSTIIGNISYLEHADNIIKNFF